MKVLIVGSGGREHTLAWALERSASVTQIHTAPGNAGTAQVGVNLPQFSVQDVDGLLAFAHQESIDLTVVGPERPLIHDAIVDRFRAERLRIYGPLAAAARLEGSKSFTDEFLARYGLTSKWFAVFDSPAPARDFVRQRGLPVVIKADGDAFGKGVKVCASLAEADEWIDRALVQKEFGAAGERIVVEQCLSGPEISVQVFTDGETFLPMVPAQDYKRIGEGDTGPNTGGMGCYSPIPVLDGATLKHILDKLVAPTISHMADEGTPITGTLYAGCMLTETGPELLEFNCRFGDPETQVVVPRLESDLYEILEATAEGRLKEVTADWSPQRCVCVVMASGGYPGDYEKDQPIEGLPEAEATGALVFHAGAALKDGQLVTAGGRVFGVTGLGDSFAEARRVAYAGVDCLRFSGAYFRRDIAERAELAESGTGPL
jgi:phosphoribosylamine--glycine ligase